MYIVEVETPHGMFFIHQLTATSLTLTPTWQKAQRFSQNELPKAEDIERSGITLKGYSAV